MVEGRGIVGIELTPETNLARRIIDKYSLSPPVDIQSMVEAYARLTFVHIPFDDIDGVSLNLKTRDKSTHVIVNSASAPSRQRFTMAHELGHILIPWHVGSVLIDQVAPVSPRSSSYFTPESWTMETEANSFAAELLMPYSWLERVISTTDDLSKIHRNISQSCQTSALSVAIRLSQFLPERVVYASERDGVVEFSGTTEGTIASPLGTNAEFPIEAFAYSDQHYVSTMQERRLHWWKLHGSHLRGAPLRRYARRAVFLALAGLPIGIPSNAPWGTPPRAWHEELERHGLAERCDLAFVLRRGGVAQTGPPAVPRSAEPLRLPRRGLPVRRRRSTLGRIRCAAGRHRAAADRPRRRRRTWRADAARAGRA